jgi:hypothetical protein
VHAALAAGGIDLPPVASRHPEEGPSACDYGPSLELAGFRLFYDSLDEDLASIGYAPVRGDIAIFMPVTVGVVDTMAVQLYRHGHIQMYDDVTRAWISDFKQPDFFPDEDTRIGYDRFRIYRHAGTARKTLKARSH